jgi:hypothetical protein
LQGQVRQHVAECPRCQSRFKQMGLISQAGHGPDSWSSVPARSHAEAVAVLLSPRRSSHAPCPCGHH